MNNDIIQNIDVYKKFIDKFNVSLLLSNNEIAKIKHSYIGYLNNLDIVKLCKELEKEDDIKIQINTTDLNYKIKNNKHDKERKEIVLIITTERMRIILIINIQIIILLI